jgi:hypothetical protein
MAEAQVETPSGWQKVRAGLLAVAGLCALLSVLLMMLRQAGGGVAFASDDTYLNLAAAHNLHLHRFLGLGLATSVPATTDTLWQLLLSVGQRLPLSAESGALVIGALMALAALLNSHRMAFYLSNRATAGAAVILVALASSLPMDVMRGHSTTLAMVLVSMLLVRYLEGGPRDRWPLPLGAAWWAGLAALVHIELLIIWVAVALHALLTGPLRRGRGHGVVFPVIRVLSSLLVVSMVLSPALAWNMQTLSVPWPRFPDAPLTLDAWAAGASPDLATASLQGSGGVVGECYRRALAVPLTAAWWPLLFLSLGLGYTVVDAVRDRQRLTGTVGLALLLVPLLYAGLYPYVGWNAAGPVFAALQPAWATLIALGIARSAITLCRVGKKMARRELPWLSPGWATSVLVTISGPDGRVAPSGRWPDRIYCRGRTPTGAGTDDGILGRPAARGTYRLRPGGLAGLFPALALHRSARAGQPRVTRFPNRLRLADPRGRRLSAQPGREPAGHLGWPLPLCRGRIRPERGRFVSPACSMCRNVSLFGVYLRAPAPGEFAPHPTRQTCYSVMYG